MTTGGLLLLLIVSLLLATVAAIASKVLDELAWHELEDYCRRVRKEDKFDDIHENADEVVVTAETLLVLGLVATAVAGAGLIMQLPASPVSITLVSILAMLALVASVVWMPREVARFWGPPFLVHTWFLWRWFDRVLAPTRGLESLVHIVLRRLDGRTVDATEEEALEDEILSIVTEGEHDGLLESGVREMIAGVIELDDMDVAQIMSPRSEMDAISVDTPWESLLEFVVKVGRTRIPVYDQSMDDVVGILYVKDLLTFLSPSEEAGQPNLRAIMRPVWQISRSTRLDELLEKFLQNRSHLAIVVDEFMHVVGLVTIEDVLEEIVGEIIDESDEEEVHEIQRVSDTQAVVQARTQLEDINERLGLRLPEEEEYDTLGGFLLSQFGRIPDAGEQLDWEDVRMTIVESSRRRIDSVRIERRSKSKVAKA